MERVLGFDLGSRTLGVAVSDPLGMIARTVETFRFEEDAEHLAYLDGKTFTVKEAWFIDKLGFKFPKELL